MERAIDLLIEASLHGLIAAFAVELLIRRLPVDDLASRTRARVAVLAFPLVTVPLLAWLAPWRLQDPFADVALFASRRWSALTVAGYPVRESVFAAFAALGVTLLLRDLLRDAAHVVAARRQQPLSLAQEPAWLEAPQAELDRLAAARGLPPVRLRPCDSPRPVLACRGFSAPYVVVSEALVRRLRPEGLRAALAHELSHVAHRDAWQDVGLGVLRVVQWFNPVAQVLARRVVQEREWRADDEAMALTGQRTALARALLESVRGGGEFLGLFGRARIAALELRCRRLLGPRPPRQGWSPAEFGVLLTSLAALACFVR